MQKPLLLWHSRLIPLLQKGAPYCLLPGQSLLRMESEMKSGHQRIGLFLGLTLLAMFAVPLNAAADNTTPNPLDLYRSLNGHLASANTFSVHIEKQFDVVRLDGAKVDYVPDGAASKTVDGIVYFVFNETYYRPFYSGSDVVYMVVENPESAG